MRAGRADASERLMLSGLEPKRFGADQLRPNPWWRYTAVDDELSEWFAGDAVEQLTLDRI
ncbi:MAG: hypothetical protein CK538_10005 [Opitutia bacterium]|nr:MAG: hypothetical protein CK538_10005 [Opitutae bacterium]